MTILDEVKYTLGGYFEELEMAHTYINPPLQLGFT